MQKADLEEKWREIQQTKLTKDNQRSLGDQTSASQEFSALDRSNKQREAFHHKRMKELDQVIADYEDMINDKRRDNENLLAEIADLEKEVEEQEEDAEKQKKDTEKVVEEDRLYRLMKRRRLVEQIKEQNELMTNLRDQIDNYMLRTFPSLG